MSRRNLNCDSLRSARCLPVHQSLPACLGLAIYLAVAMVLQTPSAGFGGPIIDGPIIGPIIGGPINGGPINGGPTSGDDDISAAEFELVETVERHRIAAIKKVVGSVIAIYDLDRKGGGSGVIIDPSGIALTNHHVIMGAGVEGWGGLADGNMYHWKLIGTDPGGDVSLIQMEGLDSFPFTPLGDSDLVQVGDWAMAMGNPFILTEDQAPTVTLGIVSGVKRYQPGAGANQLIYGNCIQVDSSINPGNSGGPLFNLNGEVIGINGRGSFKERGRVNVGLGYAISSNQIKNFIPDLLATKLVEHATLDASFIQRSGLVVCGMLNLDSPIAAAGLELGDELLNFEGTPIENANQFTNLICTIPEDWPTELTIRKSDGAEKTIVIRTFGLPYPKPPKPNGRSEEQDPEKKKAQQRQRQMVELLAAPSGEIRHKDINRQYLQHIFGQWKQDSGWTKAATAGTVRLTDQILRNQQVVGKQTLWLTTDGRFRVELEIDDQTTNFLGDGEHVHSFGDGEAVQLSIVQSKLRQPVVQAMGMTAAIQDHPFQMFGEALLDGSDKSLGHVAYRVKLLDQDDDAFYGWLGIYDGQGHRSVRLVKASADKDCDEGGVTFEDWQTVGPFRLPLRRQFIEGLAETPVLTIENKSHQWIDSIDEARFSLPPEVADQSSAPPKDPQ